MAEFPYTPNPASLRRFLEHIQTAGVPQKVTQKYIASVGFKSGNDRYIIPVLKAVGFLDGSGVPTDTWRRYRNKNEARTVMATALQSAAAFSGLFATYSDAHRKDNEALRNYFSTHTNAGEKTLALIVRTFKTLCEFADFEAAPEGLEKEPATPPPAERAPLPRAGTATGMTVNINIQLQLPATEDQAVYDKLFASLKKHLFA